MRRSFFAGALAVLGCGPEPEPVTAGLALEDAPEAFETEFCELLAECCSPFDVPSVAQCSDIIDQDITTFREVAQEWELTYDPTCWSATIDRLREDGCAAFSPDEDDDDDDDDDCRAPCKAWHGDQQVGEYCRVFDVNVTDCAPGLVCAAPFCEEGNCKEVCRDPCARSQLGERCLDIECDTGMVCDAMLDECVPAPALGETCVWGTGCGEGAMCDDATNTCVPGVDPDDPDDPDDLGPPGTPCNSYQQCQSGSCPAGFCADLPELGESCTERCATGLECSPDTSMCVAPSPALCGVDPL